MEVKMKNVIRTLLCVSILTIGLIPSNADAHCVDRYGYRVACGDVYYDRSGGIVGDIGRGIGNVLGGILSIPGAILSAPFGGHYNNDYYYYDHYGNRHRRHHRH